MLAERESQSVAAGRKVRERSPRKLRSVRGGPRREPAGGGRGMKQFALRTPYTTNFGNICVKNSKRHLCCN